MEATPECSPPLEVYCPYCRKKTNLIQAYDIPVVMFAVVYVAWSWAPKRVFGCPTCVRNQLHSQILVAVIMANVLCFIPISAIIAHLGASHSDSKPNIPPEYEYLTRLPPENRGPTAGEMKARRWRLLAILLVFVVVIGTLIFLLPVLAE